MTEKRTNFLTVAEAADRLGISASTVYDMARQRRISHCRIGAGKGRLLFTEQDIQEFIESRRVEADSISPRMGFTHSRY